MTNHLFTMPTAEMLTKNTMTSDLKFLADLMGDESLEGIGMVSKAVRLLAEYIVQNRCTVEGENASFTPFVKVNGELAWRAHDEAVVKQCSLANLLVTRCEVHGVDSLLWAALEGPNSIEAIADEWDLLQAGKW